MAATCPVIDHDFLRHRHKRFAQLHQVAPVHRVQLQTGSSAWLVVDYDTVRKALAADAELFTKNPDVLATAVNAHTPGDAPGYTTEEGLRQHVLNTDPPEHTRLRRLIAATFMPASVRRLESRISVLAADLVAATPPEEEVDLLEVLARPLPLRVICELLGIPGDRMGQLQAWSDAFVGACPVAAHASSRTFGRWLREELIPARRAAPADDLLSALINAHDDGEDQLSDDELVGMTAVLVAAGHETTTSLIANSLLAALTHPGIPAQLRGDAGPDTDAIDRLIEETLRADSPINWATTRVTRQDWTTGGTTIPAGGLVLLALGATGHDPAHFGRPQDVDLTRRPRHLAFGHGIHVCPGASLARLEARIALTYLLRRFRRIELACDPTDLDVRNAQIQNGLTSMPIRCHL